MTFLVWIFIWVKEYPAIVCVEKNLVRKTIALGLEKLQATVMHSTIRSSSITLYKQDEKF
jgi:hypothetical protein